jgi:toxin HigB-1
VVSSLHPLGEGRKKEVLLEFEDDDLRRLYQEPDFRLPGLGPDISKQYRRKMAVVANAVDERDLRNMRSLRFEKLLGKREGQHSIRLNDQYRLIFRLRTGVGGRVAVIVEVVDYH